MKKLPAGWNESKIGSIIDHYETQSEGDAIAEDEAALTALETLVQVPLELVADVRALIAKQQANG